MGPLGGEQWKSQLSDIRRQAQGDLDVNAMMAEVDKLSAALEAHDFASTEDHMKYCADTLCGLMLAVREQADLLETLVDDQLWPLPKYYEMLFMR